MTTTTTATLARIFTAIGSSGSFGHATQTDFTGHFALEADGARITWLIRDFPAKQLAEKSAHIPRCFF